MALGQRKREEKKEAGKKKKRKGGAPHQRSLSGDLHDQWHGAWSTPNITDSRTTVGDNHPHRKSNERSAVQKKRYSLLSGYPGDHITIFEIEYGAISTNRKPKLQQFSTSLSSNVVRWFNNCPPRSISLWEELIE